MAAQPLVRDVLLRDGSTLRLRAPGPDDLDDLKAFYGRLSPESRYLRFQGYGRDDVAAADYANADGDDRVALIGRHGDRVVAAAGYDVLREPGAAEVAFAVADEFQGRGAATRMLEQLAAIAAERAIHRFDAEVMQGNRGMFSVFERAGFGVRRKSAYGELTVSLDISPDEAVLERIDARDHRGVVASLRPILAPASLAVVGASSAPGNLGGAVLGNILDGGFQGVATPVNRAGGVVRSIRVARSLAELDEPPELVVIAVPPDDVPDVAAQAAECGAKALLILTAGFADARRRGSRARGARARDRPRRRPAHGRAELPRRAQHRPCGEPQRHVRRRERARRPPRDLLAVRRHRYRAARARGGPAARASRASHRSATARTSRRTTCWSCGRRTPGRPR